jgi:hypothetical protein
LVKPEVSGPSPLKETGTKAENILKEYFAVGDTAAAFLSIDELVGTGSKDGPEERGAKIVEAIIVLAVEHKPEDVDNPTNKIADTSFLKGLADPLEFLLHIEIDAPLARTIMAKLVPEFAIFSTSSLIFYL